MSSEEAPGLDPDSGNRGVMAPAAGGVPAPAGDDVPMMELTDAKLMRALAHPLRWALLEALLHAGTLTATQAGELLNETPANCAFHLRTLAKHGLVEEAGGGKGRERPWRRVDTGLNLDITRVDPQAVAAAEVLSEFWTGRTLDRARASLLRKGSWPPGWQSHRGESQNIVYLTPAEADEMHNELMRTMRRYRDRAHDPAARPPGALPIEYLILSYPLLNLASMPVPETSPDEAPAGEEDTD